MDRQPLVVWGLKKLSFAPLGKITTAQWEQLSLTKEGTFSMTFDAPTLTPIFSEELANAIATKVTQGATQTFELDIPDLSFEVLEFFGGTKETIGEAPNTTERISFPEGNIVLKKMVKIEPMEGIKAFYVTNASVTYNPSGSFTKTGDDTFNIHLTVSVNAALGGDTYEDKALKYDI